MASASIDPIWGKSLKGRGAAAQIFVRQIRHEPEHCLWTTTINNRFVRAVYAKSSWGGGMVRAGLIDTRGIFTFTDSLRHIFASV